MAKESNEFIQISFCLPVYNVKQYLKPCIDSIYRQNIDSFEIICVDDRSTDGSYEVLLELRKKIPELIVCRNDKNRGISYTRNVALRKSTGKYIWFVDADDLLPPDTTEKLLRIAEEKKAEAVLGKLAWFVDGSEPPKDIVDSGVVTPAEFSKPKTFYSHDQNGMTSFGVWLGIYNNNRGFLVSNDLFFHEELGPLEECVFHFETGLKSSRFFLTDTTVYYYRIRERSACYMENEARCRTYFDMCRRVLKIYENHLQSGCRTNNSVKAHLTDRKEISAVYLVQIPDRKYVESGLSFLKKEGYYPYKYDPETAFAHRSAKYKEWIKHYLLPNELFFWLIYFWFVSVIILKKKKKKRMQING